MDNARKEGWSYRSGEKGINRVRAYEKGDNPFLNSTSEGPTLSRYANGFVSGRVTAR